MTRSALERSSAVCAAFAFPAMALSISATQILTNLSLFLFVASALLQRRQTVALHAGDAVGIAGTASLKASYLWLAGGALYGWLLLSGIIAAFRLDGLATLARAARNEWSDIPLFFFGMMVFALCRNESYRRWIFRGVFAFAIAVALSGLLGSFSEFRLARLVTGHGFIPSAENRPQHPFATIGGVSLYRTIGMMNTRLTFAGLALLAFALQAQLAWLSWRRWSIGLRLIAVCVLVLLLATMAVNGTRSALLGWIAAVGIAALALSGTKEFRALLYRQRRRVAAALLSGIAAVTLMLIVPQPREAIVDRIQALQLRHTDFYRPIIWAGAGELFGERPLLGVGPGQFEIETRRWREDLLKDEPQLWYFFENSPAMHAHSDPLHLAATAGAPAALAFLILAGLLVAFALNQDSIRGLRDHGALLFAGAAGFCVAGLLQCYLLDDETAVVFWSVLGAGAALASRDHDAPISAG